MVDDGRRDMKGGGTCGVAREGEGKVSIFTLSLHLIVSFWWVCIHMQ